MEGKISISGFQSNQEPRRGIRLTVGDELSGAAMIEVILTPEQWGDAVSGLGRVDCTFELGNVELCGLRRETKVEKIVTAKYPTSYSKEEIAEILSRYEVDGWQARERDFTNHHNISGNTVSVIFVRFVK